uniref:Reverse transcriptase domain-containing protein n=1 Tax=Xenopus tropicalis TaxID=8364 RepID=A0A803J592_XENTR
MAIQLTSWNVRGLNCPIKRRLVLDFLKKHNTSIAFLQETHLTGSKILALKRPWVGWSYHATYSTHSSGVAILIGKKVPFRYESLKSDPKGRYLFLHCYLYACELILANIYIPPPYDPEVLQVLADEMSKFPHALCIIAGDFNEVLTPSIDRTWRQPDKVPPKTTQFAQVIKSLALLDPWKIANPNTRQFSFFSTSHLSLSRIDLVLVNAAMIPYIKKVTYLPRGISDHAPVQLQWQLPYRIKNSRPAINPTWLNILDNFATVEASIKEFMMLNQSVNQILPFWDALKVYLRNSISAEISAYKQQAKAAHTELEHQVSQLDIQAANLQTPETLAALREAQEKYADSLRQRAQHKHYFSKINIYEHGERSGKMLAHLAKAHTTPPPIPALKDSNGTLCTDPGEIENLLVAYYTDLYSAKSQVLTDDIRAFLEPLNLPSLPQEYREFLEAKITDIETQEAIDSFPQGKAAGSDGIPIELYKKHAKSLTPLLTKMYGEAISTGTFPESMYEAAIILLPKPGKDPQLCESFRPISLLTTDVKIYAKILARRLARVIKTLVNPDQIGFIPTKTTALNTRRLYLNLSLTPSNTGNRAIAALDIAKAFDTVEWSYLWCVLKQLGFGPRFINMVQLLYKSPRATLRINSLCTSNFTLSRGTRQGCPLSPLLFALAIEPFAQAVRKHPRIRGYELKGTIEIIQLYADDTLVYLGDTGQSLTALTELTGKFGLISGLNTNMSKSTLFLVDDKYRGNPGEPCPLQVTTKFTYLGIQVALHIAKYTELNLNPLLLWVQEKFRTWETLPLGPTGRIHLIKMFIQPKMLYILWHSPIRIPKKTFTKIHSQFTKFIWGTSRARLRLSTLMRPRDKGGLALPDMYMYYLAAQLTHISPMIHNELSPPLFQLWSQATNGMETPWHALLIKHINNEHLPITALQCAVLSTAHKLIKYTGYPPQMPIWQNAILPKMAQCNPSKVWQTLGITTLGDVWENGQTIPFSTLQKDRHLPTNQWLTYHKLKTALTTRWPGTDLEVNNSQVLESLLNPTQKGKMSTLYKLLSKPVYSNTELGSRARWEEELGSISDDQWDWVLETPKIVSFSQRHKLLQLYTIHRAYYTVQRLHVMKVVSSPYCHRCKTEIATLVHTLWGCTHLKAYWDGVCDWLMNKIPEWGPGDARKCLLALDLNPSLDLHTKIFIAKTLFQAKRILTLHWKDTEPPSIHEWRKAMEDLATLERTILDKKGQMLKFLQIWRHWADGTQQ